MMPNITRREGGRMDGLMRYLAGPGKHNEHTNPHLINGSPSVMAWFTDDPLDIPQALLIAKELERPWRTFIADQGAKDVPGGHVWHCSWAIQADEGRLPDTTWAAIAQDIADEMGFSGSDGKAPCRWAAVHHGQSQANNDHIHFVTSLVREDGTKASTWNDRPRAQRLARQLEEKYGLRVLESRAAGRGQHGLSQAELNIAKREGLPEPVRRSVERRVRAAAAGASTEAEFVERLRADGLKAWPWFAKGRNDVVDGYSVQLHGEGQRKWGGGSLAPDLTLPRLREAYRWENPDRPAESAQAAADAVRAWKGARAASWGRGARQAAQVDPREWQAAAGELERMVQWLAKVPTDDTAAWAVAATDAAGMFAALSRAVEGDQPGPLARAGDTLARTGEIPAWQARLRPADMPTTNSAARLVASAARGGRGSVAEAALLMQMRNTAKAIHDMHLARHEAQQATRIAATVRDGLAPLIPAPTPAPNAAPQRGVAAVMERPRTQEPGPTREGRGR